MKLLMLKLNWANIIARPLPTILTIATLAAAVSLISIMIQFSNHTSERLSRDLAGVDLVVGAKGSPLQVILSSLLHIDIPTGNIPLSEAQTIMHDPSSKSTVPIALGDSFRGFRIVGTNTNFLNLYKVTLEEGLLWTKPQQVVIGSEVFRQLNMQIGQKFAGAHGLSYSDEDLSTHNHAPFEVVGVLEARASIVDRLILTSIDSVWHAHNDTSLEDKENSHKEGSHLEHNHETDESHSHEHAPQLGLLSNLKTMDAGNKEITALLIKYKSPIAAIRMPQAINEKAGLQAASPALEITRLYNISSGLADAGKLLAIIMTIIGGLSIFVAFSNAAVHKIYDIALLRAMGAKPYNVFMLQIYEGAVISIISGILGIGLAHAVLWLAAATYDSVAVFGLNGHTFYLKEFYLLLGTIVIGMLAAIWPAWGSYRIDPMLLLKGGR